MCHTVLSGLVSMCFSEFTSACLGHLFNERHTVVVHSLIYSKFQKKNEYKKFSDTHLEAVSQSTPPLFWLKWLRPQIQKTESSQSLNKYRAL